MNVSVVIVTRGDVDLQPIFDHGWAEPCKELVVWDNSKEKNDLAVYGRYAAIERATHDVIYVQDDDCLTPSREIIDAYEPGRLVANMPRSRWEGYPDSALVGWGAIFDRTLPGLAFERREIFDAIEQDEEWFHLTCDVAFSALTPRTIIDYPFEHLPWAEGPDRMFTSRSTHSEERQRMLDLCRSIRAGDDDRRDW